MPLPIMSKAPWNAEEIFLSFSPEGTGKFIQFVSHNKIWILLKYTSNQQFLLVSVYHKHAVI